MEEEAVSTRWPAEGGAEVRLLASFTDKSASSFLTYIFPHLTLISTPPHPQLHIVNFTLQSIQLPLPLTHRTQLGPLPSRQDVFQPSQLVCTPPWHLPNLLNNAKFLFFHPHTHLVRESSKHANAIQGPQPICRPTYFSLWGSVGSRLPQINFSCHQATTTL
jgi:hypothetical protein